MFVLIFNVCLTGYQTVLVCVVLLLRVYQIVCACTYLVTQSSQMRRLCLYNSWWTTKWSSSSGWLIRTFTWVLTQYGCLPCISDFAVLCCSNALTAFTPPIQLISLLGCCSEEASVSSEHDLLLWRSTWILFLPFSCQKATYNHYIFMWQYCQPVEFSAAVLIITKGTFIILCLGKCISASKFHCTFV